MNNLITKAIFDLLSKHPFYGVLIQELPVELSTMVPTAALVTDKERLNLKILLNKDYMLRLTKVQRRAVLIHELQHYLNCHLTRLNFDDPKERQLANIAADIAINQNIAGLPDGCADCKGKDITYKCTNEKCVGKCLLPEMFKKDNGENFDKNMTAEYYLELLKTNQKWKEDFKGTTLDSHDFWEALSEEEKAQVLEKMKEQLKRTLEKTQYSYSEETAKVQDFINSVEKEIEYFNERAILTEALRKTLAMFDRQSSWTRVSRRYKEFAPGTKVAEQPKLQIYYDTSGSISIKEANEFLSVLDKFLRVGYKNCSVSFFHTEVYKHIKYKKGFRIEQTELQSGGTCLESVMKHINEKNPDLSIILTDGYYSDVKTSPRSPVVFVISKSGTTTHPLKRFGKTVKL